MANTHSSSALIVAAEASSAHYALSLLNYFKNKNLNCDFYGVGSVDMENAGFRRLGKSEEMAVVGLTEVISHYTDLKKVFENLVAESIRVKPKFVLLMDYPDFNLRLATELKKKLTDKGIKVFYYISPQVWAWRQNRIHQIKKVCDQVFVLFPFEADFYKKHNVPHQFVGHPLLEDLEDAYFDESSLMYRRQRFGVEAHEKVVALMPGSRKKELAYNFPTQLAVAQKLISKFDNVRIVVLVAPSLQKEDLQVFMEDVKFPYMLLKEKPADMISLAHVVLATSGTATLLVGLLEKPMVIMYKMNWLTAKIALLLVKGVRYFGLVNLIFNKEIVPERMQEKASAEHLFDLMANYLNDEVYFKNTKQELAKLKTKLGEKGATQRVGEALLPFL